MFKSILLCLSIILSLFTNGENVSRETIPNNEINKIICENYYTRLFVIDNIEILDDETQLLYLHDTVGHTWQYVTNIDDLFINDCIVGIMQSCGNEYIFDDIIVSIQYCRPDLL